jgi:hypothetical protein
MLESLFKLFHKNEENQHQENEDDTLFIDKKNSNHYEIRHNKFIEKIAKHKFGETTATGENLDAIKLYDLSIEEASIIYMYTNHQIYNNVNYQLRNRKVKVDEDVEEYKNLLNNSLDKLPSVNNMTIYRDINNPDDEIKGAMHYYIRNIGAKIICKDFMSCHKSDSRWSDEETGFQMVIKTNKNSRGKDLSNITYNVEEKEVLFKSGTFFFVDDVNIEKTTVYLTEMS